MLRKTKSLEERFWEKVDKSPGLGPNGDCWLWTGARNKGGYGNISEGKRGGKTLRAHIVSFELAHGRKTQWEILHSCDVRRCVNPKHLTEGTRLDNMQDAKRKGRTAHGVRHGRVKLTERQVRAIKKARSQGVSLKEIASRFSVSEAQVSRIASCQKWSYLC